MTEQTETVIEEWVKSLKAERATEEWVNTLEEWEVIEFSSHYTETK